MTDATRIVLIALGVALLVVVLVPALFMGVCMATGMTGGMSGMMGGGGMMGSAPWAMGGFALLILAIAVALLIAGVRRGTSTAHH
jgi:hypothetical protein